MGKFLTSTIHKNMKNINETPRAADYATAILSGDTYQFREILKRAGWQFDNTTKTWRKAVASDSQAEDVLRQVRGLGGVRNRGNLEMAIAKAQGGPA